jgi:hypothetical protein
MLGRNVQINFFIWIEGNPARADESAVISINLREASEQKDSWK